MGHDDLFPLIFRLVTTLPTRQQQLLILAEAWLLVAKEDLQSTWKSEKFEETQTNQLTMLDSECKGELHQSRSGVGTARAAA